LQGVAEVVMAAVVVAVEAVQVAIKKNCPHNL
jgi:hypothetical protein